VLGSGCSGSIVKLAIFMSTISSTTAVVIVSEGGTVSVTLVEAASSNDGRDPKKKV
jgi:hypothetical protein